MGALKNVLLWSAIGALIGVWVGGLLGKQFVTFYNTPGSGIVAQCECRQLTIDTASRMLAYELWGMAAGALLFLVLAIVFGSGRRRGPSAPAPAAPAA